MNILDAFLLLILGLGVGLPASMLGLGGGFLLVPALILLFHLPTQNVIAISLVAMFGTSLSATLAYLRQRRIDYKLSILYDVLDIPGVIVGAYLTTIIPSNILSGICGLFIASISILLLKFGGASSLAVRKAKANRGWRRKLVDSSNRKFEYAIISPALALVSSFLSGLVAGLAGLGGGIVDTSTMILLGVPPHIAAASSELAMTFTNGIGVLAHGILQNILPEYAVPLTIGTVIGAQMGSSVAKHVEEKYLRRILAAIALILGLRLTLFLLP